MNAPDFSLELSVHVEAPPEVIFDILLDPVRFSAWLEARAEFAPEPGSELTVAFDRFGTRVQGEILEVDPPRRMVFSWGVAEGPQQESLPAGSTRVVLTLAPEAGGTRVTLRHLGLPSDEEVRNHTGGWLHYLANLQLQGNQAALAPHLEAVLDRYFQAWSETDAAARDDLLGSACHPDLEFRDRFASIDGLTAFSAHLGQVQRLFPEGSVRRLGAPEVCHGHVQVGWTGHGPGGQPMGSGRLFLRVGPDAMIRRIVSFRDDHSGTPPGA